MKPKFPVIYMHCEIFFWFSFQPFKNVKGVFLAPELWKNRQWTGFGSQLWTADPGTHWEVGRVLWKSSQGGSQGSFVARMEPTLIWAAGSGTVWIMTFRRPARLPLTQHPRQLGDTKGRQTAVSGHVSVFHFPSGLNTAHTQQWRNPGSALNICFY